MYIKNILKGIIIGLGVIIPGVSGSVLAIILGVYEKIIYILNNLKKDIVNNIKYVLTILIGILIGMMLFGNFIRILLDKYNTLINFTFVALILSSVPSLKNEMNKKGVSVNKYIVILTLLFSLALFCFSGINFKQSTIYHGNISIIIILFLAGILFISGKIIPGISSSFFMMILGMYDYILLIMSSPFSISIYSYIELIPFIIGCLIGFIVLSKLINYLLLKHYRITYSAIIGFVLGSIVAIIPSYSQTLEYFVSLMFGILVFFISLLIFGKTKK